MTTRANVVIEYEDDEFDHPMESWLYCLTGGNVQVIGKEVVQAIHDYPFYVDFTVGIKQLLQNFGSAFENADADGLHGDIEFLHRVTYADNKVTIVARHGGYAGEDAEQHYSRENDTPDNTVELYSATFKDDLSERRLSFHFDIREPESYLRRLRPDAQPAARAWRGRLRQGRA
jgi:hypothetical protein